MSQQRGRSMILAVVTAVSIGLASGCAAGSATAGPAAAPAAGAAAGTSDPRTSSGTAAVAGVCANLLAIDAVPAPDSGPDNAESITANKAFAEAVRPQLRAAVTAAPADLAASLAVLLPIVEATGQGTALPVDDPALTAAIAGYEAWAHANCGFQAVDLMAMDYEFEGAPVALEPGPTSFSLMNHSERDEVHSAVLIRRHQDQQVGIEELFEVPLDQLTTYGDLVPGSATADPGATGGLLVDLSPGHYFLICALQSDPDDPNTSHMLRGMLAEFEVA